MDKNGFIDYLVSRYSNSSLFPDSQIPKTCNATGISWKLKKKILKKTSLVSFLLFRYIIVHCIRFQSSAKILLLAKSKFLGLIVKKNDLENRIYLEFYVVIKKWWFILDWRICADKHNPNHNYSFLNVIIIPTLRANYESNKTLTVIYVAPDHP